MANKRFIDFRLDTEAGNGSYLVGHDSTGMEFRIPVSNLLAGLPTPEVPTLKVQWSANGSSWTDQWSESSHYIRVKVGSAAWSGAMRISLEKQIVRPLLTLSEQYVEVEVYGDNIYEVPSTVLAQIVTCNQSISDLIDAYNAGKAIIAEVNDQRGSITPAIVKLDKIAVPLVVAKTTSQTTFGGVQITYSLTFSLFRDNQSVRFMGTCSFNQTVGQEHEDVWSFSISDNIYEEKANLTQQITSSSKPHQYPSAAAVYSALRGIGGTSYDGDFRMVLPIHFSPRTEKHPIDLNYCLDYSENVVVHCDTGIGQMVDNTQTASDYMTVEYPMIGIVDDYYRKRVEGYLFDGRFYEDSAHTIELFCDEENIYIDLTGGENDAPYRYISGHFEEFVWGEGYANTQGYYNVSDGKFYEDSSFRTPVEEQEYSVYQDLTTGKYYAWIAECFIGCQIEAWLMEHGRLQIANMSIRGDGNLGTRVKFQYFDANNELTFNGVVMQNYDENIDLWSMNLSQNKYEEKANKVQSISKSSEDAYPSSAAVIAYVQQNS
ncbi:MAG: hypothetical protein IJU33_00155 [Bacteroidales bacterium]|nr:hypothetical protein [Bacteroidales bacterium]